MEGREKKREFVSLVRKSTLQLLSPFFRASTSLEGFGKPTVKVEKSFDKQVTKISIIERSSQNSKLSIRPELIARKTQVSCGTRSIPTLGS